MSKYSANLLGIFAIAVIVALVGFAVSRKTTLEDTPIIPNEPVVCTMDAKICPDGSAVGRTGPSCEFAPCPMATSTPLPLPSSTGSWNLFQSPTSSVTFTYPKELGTTYMRANAWPPEVKTEKGRFTCFETKATPQGFTVRRTIQGVQYCVTTQSEGAAGSIFSTYTYLSEKEGTRVHFKFTIQETQCGNYDEPKRSECVFERNEFSVDDLAHRMMNSVVSVR
jgi:hypothetical protein